MTLSMRPITDEEINEAADRDTEEERRMEERAEEEEGFLSYLISLFHVYIDKHIE